jgi:uncharacterized protein
MEPEPSLSGIPEDVQRTIQTRLDEIERDKSVRILLAVESGSRAWGFATEHSDYDVRFIFVRQKLDYLTVDEERIGLSYPTKDIMEISGWDLRYALRLGLSYDPPALVDRLTSPIVYRERGGGKRLRCVNCSYAWGVQRRFCGTISCLRTGGSVLI